MAFDLGLSPCWICYAKAPNTEPNGGPRARLFFCICICMAAKPSAFPRVCFMIICLISSPAASFSGVCFCSAVKSCLPFFLIRRAQIFSGFRVVRNIGWLGTICSVSATVSDLIINPPLVSNSRSVISGRVMSRVCCEAEAYLEGEHSTMFCKPQLPFLSGALPSS